MGIRILRLEKRLCFGTLQNSQGRQESSLDAVIGQDRNIPGRLRHRPAGSRIEYMAQPDTIDNTDPKQEPFHAK